MEIEKRPVSSKKSEDAEKNAPGKGGSIQKNLAIFRRFGI